MSKEKLPLVMTEHFWANSQLSIARYTGRVKMDGAEYVICNKDGKDIFQCSFEADMAGREKAIESGEPADLVRTDVLPIYRKLGRDRFLRFCKENPDCWTLKEIKERLKTWQAIPKNRNAAIASIVPIQGGGLLAAGARFYKFTLPRTNLHVFQSSPASRFFRLKSMGRKFFCKNYEKNFGN